MIYLVILVLLAGGAILKLWLHQRRTQRLDTSDEFWNGLERIAADPEPMARPVRAVSTRPRRASRSGARPSPLDPERRAAAKQRIQARRRAIARRTVA